MWKIFYESPAQMETYIWIKENDKFPMKYLQFCSLWFIVEVGNSIKNYDKKRNVKPDIFGVITYIKKRSLEF